MKKLLIISLILLAGCSNNNTFGVEKTQFNNKKLKTSKEKIIKSENIKECSKWKDEKKLFCDKYNESIKYYYLSEKKSNNSNINYLDIKDGKKTLIEENVLKRTKNSISFDLPDNKKITKIFSVDKFFKINNEWYDIVSATTTRDIFEKETSKNYIINYALAADTFYSTTNDGGVYYLGGGSWSSVHNATSGTARSSSDTTINALSSTDAGYFIERGFLPFDTSSIPDSDTISEAYLFIYGTSKTNNDNDGEDFITVVKSSQYNPNGVLINDDYDQVGSTEAIDSSERKDITSIIVDGSGDYSGYTRFQLNSTGIGFIDKVNTLTTNDNTKGTLLGIREGHDLLNSSVVGGYSLFTFASNNDTSGNKDPYLLITHTSQQTVAETDYSQVIFHY